VIKLSPFLLGNIFFTNLQHHFSTVKVHETNYKDVYDGHLYQELMVPNGIFLFKSNISLMWNVDGLPLLKSSKFSYGLCILSLMNCLISCKGNMIIAGLWFGESMKPIVKELIALEQHGVEVKPPLCNSFISKVILFAGTRDLPAKCLVLNCTQFNGEFGCSKFLEPGITLTSSARGHTHVYPYNSLFSDGHCQNRTKETHHVNFKKALRESTIVDGIKDP